MATKVMIEGLPTHIGRDIVYELYSASTCTGPSESTTKDTDWEEIDTVELIEGELGEYERATFVLSDPYRDLEPCKAAFADDRYSGKCKKLRREARGW